MSTNKMEQVIKTLSEKCARYHCGPRTAWIQWMSQEEKQGIDFADVQARLQRKGVAK